MVSSKLSLIRNLIGDPEDDALISTQRLVCLLDEAEGSVYAAALNAAYELRGLLSLRVDLSNTDNLITERRHQRYRALVDDIIPHLELMVDRGGRGKITMGTLRLNINQREDRR